MQDDIFSRRPQQPIVPSSFEPPRMMIYPSPPVKPEPAEPWMKYKGGLQAVLLVPLALLYFGGCFALCILGFSFLVAPGATWSFVTQSLPWLPWMVGIAIGVWVLCQGWFWSLVASALIMWFFASIGAPYIGVAIILLSLFSEAQLKEQRRIIREELDRKKRVNTHFQSSGGTSGLRLT